MASTIAGVTTPIDGQALTAATQVDRSGQHATQTTAVSTGAAAAGATVQSSQITVELPNVSRSRSRALKHLNEITDKVATLVEFQTVLENESSTPSEKIAAFKKLPEAQKNLFSYFLWVNYGAPTPLERERAGLEPLDTAALLLSDPTLLMEDALPLFSSTASPTDLVSQLESKLETELMAVSYGVAQTEIKDYQTLLESLSSNTTQDAAHKQAIAEKYYQSMSELSKELLKPIVAADEGGIDPFRLLDPANNLTESYLENAGFIPAKWSDKKTNATSSWTEAIPPSWNRKTPIKNMVLLLTCLQNESKNANFQSEKDTFVALYNHPSTTRYQLKAAFKLLSDEVKETLEADFTPPFIGYKLDSEVHKTQGAHLQFDPDTGDVTGCKFSVFSPNANSVNLVIRDWKAVQPKENASGGIDYTVAASFAKTTQIVVIADDNTETKTNMTDNGDGTFSVHLPEATLATHIRYEMKTEENPATVITYSSEQAKGMPALRYSPMVKDEDTGTFSFASDRATEGTCYQYEIEYEDGTCILKQDPFGFGEGFTNHGEHALPLANSGNAETRNFHHKNPTATKAVLTATKSDGTIETQSLIKNMKTGIFYLNLPTEETTKYTLTVTLANGETKTSPIQANHCFNGVSVVRNTNSFLWSDGDFMSARDATKGSEKSTNTYELYAQQWKKIPRDIPSTQAEMEKQITYFATSPKTTKATASGGTIETYKRGKTDLEDSLTVEKNAAGDVISVLERSIDQSKRVHFVKDAAGVITKTLYEKATFRSMAQSVITWCKSQSYDSIELVGALGHPDVRSMGYQVTGYFTPSSSLGNLDDMKHFVNELHKAGIGVIIDHVPFHFASNDFGLESPDNLYGAEGKNRLSNWNTSCFGFDKPHVKSFLLSSLRHLLEDLHIDGIRMDAVAHLFDHTWGRGDHWDSNRNGGVHDKGGLELIRGMHQMIERDFPGVFTSAEDWNRFCNTAGDTNTKSGLRKDSMKLRRGLGFDQKWLPRHFDFRKFLAKPERERTTHEEQQIFMFRLMTGFMSGVSNTNAFCHDESTLLKGTYWNSMANHGDEWGPEIAVLMKKVGNYSHFLSLTQFLPSRGKLQYMGNDTGQKRVTDKRVVLKDGAGTEDDRKLLRKAIDTGMPFLYGSGHDSVFLKDALSLDGLNDFGTDERFIDVVFEEQDWEKSPVVTAEFEAAVREGREFDWERVKGAEGLTTEDRIAILSAEINKFSKDHPDLREFPADVFSEDLGERGYKDEDGNWHFSESFQKELDTNPTLRAWVSHKRDDNESDLLTSFAPFFKRVADQVGFSLVNTSDCGNGVFSYIRTGSTGKKYLFVHHISDESAFEHYDLNIPAALKAQFSGIRKAKEIFNTTKFLNHDAYWEEGKTYYNEGEIPFTINGSTHEHCASLNIKVGRSATMVFDLLAEDGAVASVTA